MRISKRVVLAGTALATATVALAGATAGSSAPQTKPPPSPIVGLVNSLNGLSAQARETRLYNLAKQEGGTLELYTSLTRTILPEVVKEFQAKYPAIKVNAYRASSEDVVARLTQEASAGASGADVVETNGTEMLFFQHRANVLVPYRGSPYASSIPDAYRFNTWTADRIEAFVVAWNTNLVGSGQQPTSFQSLANSTWSGKLAMEPTDADWFAALYTYLEKQALSKLKPAATAAGRRKQKAAVDRGLDAMFARIARNSKMIGGHTTLATLLAAGQYSVCVTCHAQSIEALQDNGAPITFKPFVQPILIRPQGIGIVYRLKHKATALLFYDWMLRKDGGQKALLAGGSNPARKDMGDADLARAKRVNVNLRPIVSHWGFWSNKYEGLVRLAGG
jgi:iron(III) transport system substrate-binding protein